LSEAVIAFPVSATFPAGGFKGSVFDGYFSIGPFAAGISNWEDVQALTASGVKAKVQASTMACRQQIVGLRNANGSIQSFTSKSFGCVSLASGDARSTDWIDIESNLD
jgi:hypothetical protein